jgi:hypothetical protein
MVAKKKKTKGRRAAAKVGAARKPKKPSRRQPSKVSTKKAMAHPVFGRVTVDPGEGVYWQKTLVLADRDVSVDMTIDASEATPELLDRAAQLVTRLAHFDALARAGLRWSSDENSDSAVAFYAAHHLEQLSSETLKAIFGKPVESIAVDDFLAHLFLKRVGSYPAKRGGTATFDYTISTDETQYILSVQLDESGEVLGIEMES